MNQKILEGDFSTNYKASAFFNIRRYTLFPFVKRYLLDSLTANTSGITSAGSDENYSDSRPMFFLIPLPSMKQTSDTVVESKLEKRPIPHAKRSHSNFSNPKR